MSVAQGKSSSIRAVELFAIYIRQAVKRNGFLLHDLAVSLLDLSSHQLDSTYENFVCHERRINTATYENKTEVLTYTAGSCASKPVSKPATDPTNPYNSAIIGLPSSSPILMPIHQVPKTATEPCYYASISRSSSRRQCYRKDQESLTAREMQRSKSRKAKGLTTSSK